MESKLPHRGAQGDLVQFARAFVRGRLTGFEKDIQICLTPIPHPVEPDRPTHAYFPALATCCATLEYFARLYHGKVLEKKLGREQLNEYAGRFLPQPDYDVEMIRILFDAFRNAVAHRGVPSGVWIDKHRDGGGRRFTWKIYEDYKSPSMQIKPEARSIIKASPWPCRYTHRVHIHVGRLAQDICDSAADYVEALVSEKPLQGHFLRCMVALYPK